MVIPFFFTFESPVLHKYTSASSLSKVIQLLNSAVSCDMLQVAFSFQNSVKVTYVRLFFNFKCVLEMFLFTVISFSERV